MIPGNRIGMVGIEHMRASGLREESGPEGSILLHIPIGCHGEYSALVQSLERRSQSARQGALSRSGAAGDTDNNALWHMAYSCPIERLVVRRRRYNPNRLRPSIPLAVPARPHIGKE